VLIYGVYSNGFKSGGFNGEVINNATHFTDEGLFGAETVDAVEAGVKYTGDGLIANAATFYNFYDSPQARIFVPFSTQGGGSFTSNSLSNLDEAVSYGVEVSADWQAMDGLDFSASATWLRSEIMQGSNPDVPQNAAAFDGNPLPFASELSAVVSAAYTWSLNDKVEAMMGLNGKYQSEFYLDAEGREDRRQDGYGLIDGRAELRFSNGISAQIWGRNLTNADYAVSGYGFIGYNTFRGAPRSYGLTLGYAY
jgi:iron complex outermembrane receptor protein